MGAADTSACRYRVQAGSYAKPSFSECTKIIEKSIDALLSQKMNKTSDLIFTILRVNPESIIGIYIPHPYKKNSRHWHSTGNFSRVPECQLHLQNYRHPALSIRRIASGLFSPYVVTLTASLSISPNWLRTSGSSIPSIIGNSLLPIE